MSENLSTSLESFVSTVLASFMKRLSTRPRGTRSKNWAREAWTQQKSMSRLRSLVTLMPLKMKIHDRAILDRHTTKTSSSEIPLKVNQSDTSAESSVQYFTNQVCIVLSTDQTNRPS